MEPASRRISTLTRHIVSSPSSLPASSGEEVLSAQPVAATTYENVLVEKRGRVGVVTLNRPSALNALSTPHVRDIVAAVQAFEDDESVGAIVITGSNKAFAAGADIKQMSDMTYSQSRFAKGFLDQMELMTKVTKPVIAAVNGYAFGGGCELAMQCDIIIAGDNAQFGQPEIKIGTIPGLGGTQRLTKAVGKSKAMEMCLTGDPITAQEAERLGLVSRVVPAAQTLETAVKLGEKIASLSRPIVAVAKESVNVAYESTLAEGLRFERRAFQSTFGFTDRKEGMDAFANKRKPQWKNE